ncbi:unnamed protein product [Linum trigynum]|uniref:Uncharacterized protein n=1 Tax=Linum trigynum TaxID=586398 RepID=A0AAV2D5M6_9ROSI
MASKMKMKHEKYWGDVDKMNKLLYIVTLGLGDSALPSAEEDPEEVEKINEELNKLMNVISIRDNLVSSTSASNVESGRRNESNASSSACGDNSDVSMHD